MKDKEVKTMDNLEYTEDTKYSGLDETMFKNLGAYFHKFMECSGASREELSWLIINLKKAQNKKEECLSSILEKRKKLNTNYNQILD